ncbi:hypothetical protein Rhal01_02175 [Rubritalea halochordaticola]|uniref:Uncharacterized protein n=1 Tax=Rubritalea halochordaticola TaxID=714537 RepID=A0ABP9V313_9BACT
MRLLIPSSIALALVLALLISAFYHSNDGKGYTFKGEESFTREAAELTLTLEQARQHLIEDLQRSGQSYTPHPEEVILIHNQGYLFLDGDFKLNIPLKGYHVDSQGAVSKVDLQENISVEGYMKQIGRDGWNSPAHKE